MPESKSKNHPPETTLKSVVVVLATLVALGFLIVRPLLDTDDEKNVDDQVANQSTSQDKAPANTAGQQQTENKNKHSSSESSKQSATSNKKLDDLKTTRKQKLNTQNRTPQKTVTKSQSPRGPPQSKTQKFSGKLAKVSKDILRSETGLIYGPGSREGHRLAHVMEHAKDNPSKPIHGVFDGSQNEIISLVDQAYDRVKKNHRSVSSSKAGKRTSYSVYFGKRIGYVGGRSGKQKNNPIAKTLVLVLEDERVITAYPK